MGPASKPEASAVLAVTLRASDKSQEERLRQALREIVKQDPSIELDDLSKGETVLAGRDESHIEDTIARLMDQFAADFAVSEPRVLYRETIRRNAEGEGKYIRQIGGSGNYGHCRIRLEPNQSSNGYEFINELAADVIPNEFIGSIEEGVQAAMRAGVLAGFPLVNLTVRLFGGSRHELDSNAMAFKAAGSIALREAAKKASPVLLEPMMQVQMTVPEEFAEAAVAQLKSRQGRIESSEHIGRSTVIAAIVPLSEVLSNSARGRLRAPMQFFAYEPVPYGQGSEGDELGVPAGNPNRPKPRRGFMAAEPDKGSDE